MALRALLESVAKKVTPSRAQAAEIRSITELVAEQAEQACRGLGIGHTIAGSYTRSTYMLDKKEFDVFLLFPDSTARDTLEKKGLELGKKIAEGLGGSWIVAYAEHPYVRAKIKSYNVDIVPAFKVKSADRIISAVDRTPFHNEWLRKRLKEEQKKEVRLFKQFLKGQGLYGSDEKTRGFSGYLCELLVVHYGNFTKLLAAASNWQAGTHIDIEGHGQPADRKFAGQPLVVIDPVDPQRNVASVIIAEHFVKLVRAAERFLDRPSEAFFFPDGAPDLTAVGKLLETRQTRMLAITFGRPDVIDDILYPQLRKAARRIAAILHENDFRVMGHAIHADGRCCILLEMEVWELPAIYKAEGPSVFDQAHAKQFLAKYRKLGRVWVEDGKYVAEVARRFPLAKQKLAHSLGKPEAVLIAKGIPSYVAKALAAMRLLEGKDVLALAARENGLAATLQEYLQKDYS
ncbi:MAG: CCA tRNA nucleotidyltransferase [Candidatus Aenigmarchaeota archaeon]|nr:CCA tRNA nucleotidyltransferase [Candidatus Aenigmarchaeota archaeon]